MPQPKKTPPKTKYPLAAEPGSPQGKGGVQRRRRFDEIVDDAVRGRQRAGQTTDRQNGF